MKHARGPFLCLFFQVLLLAFSCGVRADSGLTPGTTPQATPDAAQGASGATGPAPQAGQGQTTPQVPPTSFSASADAHAAGLRAIAVGLTPGNKGTFEDKSKKAMGFVSRSSEPPVPQAAAAGQPQGQAPAPAGGAPVRPLRPPTLPPDDKVEATRVYDDLDAIVLTDPRMIANPDEQRRAQNIINNGRVRIGDNEGAVKGSSRVLHADPDNRDALNNRALGQYGMGQYKEAVQDTSRLVGLDQGDQRALTTRALAFFEMKDYASALEDAKRALALDKNNETAHYIAKLSEMRVTTPDQLGMDQAQKAAADKVKQEFAAVMEQRNQLDAASGAAPVSLRQGAVVNPVLQTTDGFVQQARDKMRARNPDPRGAVKLLDMALQRSPGDPAALGARSVAQSMLGDFDRAAQDAAAALERAPDDTAALDARAAALLRLGRLAEARLDADRSIALNPRSAYAYMNRARIREAAHEFAGAIVDAKAAARLGPQFDPELQRMARRLGISLEAETGAAARPAAPQAQTGKPAAAPPPEAGGSRRVLVVLVSSVSGGLLIAFGLMHVVTGQQGRRGARLKALLPGAGADTIQALGSGPALRAGYKVTRAIGNGGMGVVYEAVDKALGRKVAVKQMRPEIRDNPKERERFLQEARIVAALHHPNIVDIHSIVEDEGDLCMVFEFVEGRTVEDILNKKGRLTVREAQYIIRGVCNALDFAHRKGVIHRDLKPSNIMITNEGRVKVMDFGIARQAKDALLGSTSTQTVAGTPLYMAPEQEQGIVRTESDLYALGACLYEMVTGERPFKGPTTTASKLAKDYPKPSRVTSGLPSGLDALIDAALEPDPDRRIHTAADFATRFEALQVAA